MSTIRDVAKRAGVAISTVSAVINRSASTSNDVVARVERAIAEIGYAPQSAAQTLRSGCSKVVGVIVPDITNPLFHAREGCRDRMPLGRVHYLCLQH